MPQTVADDAWKRAVAGGDFGIRRRLTISRLIVAVPGLLVVVRWLWPLSLPLWSTGIIAAILLFVSQYHLWSWLSSGSQFAPEFPRAIVIMFNWAFGAIAVLAVLQILLDVGTLTAMLAQQRALGAPDVFRYAFLPA